MAKRTVATPPTATQLTSKSRTETKASLPSAQRYFWDYAELAWKYAGQYQEQLAARRPMLTKEYIAAQMSYIAEVRDLPNYEVRSAKTTKSRVSLSAHRQGIVSEVNLLDSAILLTYKAMPELIQVELKESGITALRAATSHDWAAVSTFLTAFKTYFMESGQKLVEAGAITPKFADELETKGKDFEAAKAEFTDKKQSAKDGTYSVTNGVKQIKAAIGAMQEVGKNVFEFEPEQRKLFTAAYVLNEVRSKHPANIVGRTNIGPLVEGTKPKPLANILVEVLGETGKTATTDEMGRYKLLIAGGEYQVRYSGDGMSPITLKVVVKPGIDRRVNVVLEPAPAPVAEVAAPTATLGSMLNNSLKEVETVITGTTGAGTSSTTAHSTNGVAV